MKNIDDLPNELLYMIFEYLDTAGPSKDRIRNAPVLELSKVCRDWRTLLRRRVGIFQASFMEYQTFSSGLYFRGYQRLEGN